MCVVMSHGTKLEDGNLGVLGVDGKIVDIETEVKSLFSNYKCPTLVNKPKLFFVDADWGNYCMTRTDIIAQSLTSGLQPDIYANKKPKSLISIVNYPDMYK